ncbi:hypothetical protein [Cytobacillus oceanisediminis]|uniref:hypothetical protein n=1 Tax=Cytobacillus oceanisediminis TaxID=665099 RepID=UPI001FB3E0C2|nr:hypothetical protein [Cytobacillus oceanisediminis]UOE58106.1 hypothetical protein IRB79_26725 [Cytobacillus oceanisediminis]
MDNGFDGLMLANVWNGLKLKKEKNMKSISLKVLRMDGTGLERVVFQEVMETYLPNEYTLVGTCSINGKPYTFEYRAPFGNANHTVIGFKPMKVTAGVG